VFVKGFFEKNWTHKDLYFIFAKYGAIISAKVSLDKEHKSKGFGYIQY